MEKDIINSENGWLKIDLMSIELIDMVEPQDAHTQLLVMYSDNEPTHQDLGYNTVQCEKNKLINLN